MQDWITFMLNEQRNNETTLRIGEMLTELEKLPKDFPITISMEWLEGCLNYWQEDTDWGKHKKEEYGGKQMYFDGTFGSDRGDYAKLYLGYTFEENKFLVKDLISLLNKAKKQGAMVGYKGGVFDINDRTLITIAEYGFSEGIRPICFELKENEVVLRTKYKS